MKPHTLTAPQRDYLAAASYRDAVKLKSTDSTLIKQAESHALTKAKVLSHWAYTKLKQRNQDTADKFRRLAFMSWESAAQAALDLEVR